MCTLSNLYWMDICVYKNHNRDILVLYISRAACVMFEVLLLTHLIISNAIRDIWKKLFFINGFCLNYPRHPNKSQMAEPRKPSSEFRRFERVTATVLHAHIQNKVYTLRPYTSHGRNVPIRGRVLIHFPLVIGARVKAVNFQDPDASGCRYRGKVAVYHAFIFGATDISQCVRTFFLSRIRESLYWTVSSKY